MSFKNIFTYFFPKRIDFSIERCISSSAVLLGKRNFRKFHFPNRRGTAHDRDYLRAHPEMLDCRGVQNYGVWEQGEFTTVPELIPELVVPDLKGFELKPYVSYRTSDIVQEKFTPKHLFYNTYAPKIKADFISNDLSEDGSSLAPSSSEKLTASEARSKIIHTGSDLFG